MASGLDGVWFLIGSIMYHEPDMNASTPHRIRPGGSLRRTGTPHTLRLQVLMEQQKKAEIGERIRELREASRHTNRSIADELGVSERAVAKWMAGGGIAWDNVVSLAKLFDVEENYIWSGDPRAETPDVMGALSPTGLGELEKHVHDLVVAVAEVHERMDRALANQVEQLARLGEVRHAQEEMLSRLERIERSRGRTGNG